MINVRMTLCCCDQGCVSSGKVAVSPREYGLTRKLPEKILKQPGIELKYVVEKNEPIRTLKRIKSNGEIDHESNY